MKKNRFFYFFLLLSAAITLNTSCSSNDESTDDGGGSGDEPIVTVADFSSVIEEGSVANGDVLGNVTGTSNQGSVNFELTSQTPAGAMSINATNGELSVADATQFVANEQVTGVVTITKDAVTKTANVTIDVVPIPTITCDTPLDIEIDLSAFKGDLVLSAINTEDDSLIGELQGSGDSSSECGIVIVTGQILDGDFCDLEPEVTFNLVPTDATTGTFLVEEKTPFMCIDFSNDDPPSTNSIQGSGTYDLTPGAETIIFDYTWFQEDVSDIGESSSIEIYSGRTIITPGTADPDAGNGDGGDGGDGGDSDYEIVITDPVECAGMVDTSIFNGALTLVEDFGDGSVTEPIALVGTPGETCSLTLVGDLVNYGCLDESYVIFFIPDSEGATTGTIISDEQLFDCEDDEVVTSVIIGGTYDLSIPELRLTYEYLSNGNVDFLGDLIITLTP